LEIEPLLGQGLVNLLDHPQLIRELKQLERQLRPGGKQRVDHPRGVHDDHANVFAVAATTALQALAQVTCVDPEPSLEERRAVRALGFRFPEGDLSWDGDVLFMMDLPDDPKW
jgi:hypothetical protein